MTAFEIIKKTHFAVVTIFFLIYLVKTLLLLTDKKDALASFTKKVKVLEMVVSFLFLATGVYLMIQLPEIKPMLIIKITIVFLSIPLAVVGFKKGNKGLATLAFVLILAAFGMGEMMKNKKAVVSEKSVNADGTISGQEFYTNNCASCHGADGKLKMAGAFDLSATQLSNDSISSIILNGRNTMTKINGLTPEQAQAIAAYVSTNIKGK
ncbi:MAG: c-type cytochrome [Bacteroidia bacterium]